MAKRPANANKPWTPANQQQLRKLARENTPTRVIALKMDRTEASIRSKASDLGVSLKPVNQSPYNRQRP
jgi:hypothetical protein